MAEKTSSNKWMTYKQVAEHFHVSETTVRLGRGVFASLRRVPFAGKCIRISRAEVERLDRAMERAAVALAADVVSIEEHRKSA
jgi:hypothetical protein